MNLLQAEIDKLNIENPTLEFGNDIIRKINHHAMKCRKNDKKPSPFYINQHEWSMLRMNPVLFAAKEPPEWPDGLRIYGIEIKLK